MATDGTISVLVPSRRRAKSLQVFVHSLFENAKFKEKLEVIVYLDHDEVIDYPRLKNVKYIHGTETNLAKMYNLCAERASGVLFFIAADDLQVRTRSWDEIVRSIFAMFEDTLLVVHGDDLGTNPLNFGTHFFVHKNWRESLGFIYPDSGTTQSDIWISRLADRLGKRVFVSDLVVEHLHPSWGKSKLDSTYLKGLKRASVEVGEFEANLSLSLSVRDHEQILRRSKSFVAQNFNSPLVLNHHLKEVQFNFASSWRSRLLKLIRWKVIRFKLWYST